MGRPKLEGAKIYTKRIGENQRRYLLEWRENGNRKFGIACKAVCRCKNQPNFSKPCEHLAAAFESLKEFGNRETTVQVATDSDIETTVSEYETTIVSQKRPKTQISYKHSLKIFLAFMKSEGIRLFSEVNNQILDRFVAALRAGFEWENGKVKPQGDTSTLIHLRNVRAFFGTAKAWKKIPFNPLMKSQNDNKDFFKGLKGKKRINVLTEKEIAKLLKCDDELVRDMSAFMLNLGLRIGEVVNLKWEQIGKDSIAIVERKDKDGNIEWKPKGGDRVLFVPPPVAKVLKERAGVRNCDYVFSTDRGTAFDIRNVERRFRFQFDSLKLQGQAKATVTPHDLRHTFASFHYARKGSASGIKEILGHSDLKTTQDYISQLKDSTKKHLKGFDITG